MKQGKESKKYNSNRNVRFVEKVGVHMYKVYEVLPECNYSGTALVAAENIEEANQFILAFKQSDKDNRLDSWGYGYVDDVKEHLFSDIKGIVDYGIYYSG